MTRHRIGSVTDMRAYMRMFDEQVPRIVKTALIELMSDVIENTPVDTSRLIYNWQVKVGTPARGEVPGAWPATGTHVRGTESAAISALRQGVETMVLSTRSTRKIHITNNVEYAYAVEFFGSSSAQDGRAIARPAAMLRGALGDWDRMVERAAR